MVLFLTYSLSNFHLLNAILCLREYSIMHEYFINLSGEELGKGVPNIHAQTQTCSVQVFY